MEGIESERAAVLPFGEFNPADIGRLREAGVSLRLWEVSAKRPLVVPEGAVVREVSAGASRRYVAVVSMTPVEMVGRELPPPTRSLSAVEAELAAVRGELAETEGHLRDARRHRDVVERQVKRLEDRERFLLARDGMGAWERVSYLKGYCPVSRVQSLEAMAATHGWGLLTEDPAPDEEVPTLLSNARWVRPVKAVFDTIGILPGYREIDISACFLLFFSLFFAMLVGDAGYGAVFLLLTIAARRKMPKAPAQPFALMGIMSVCTILWGFLTGTFFGLADPPPFLLGLKVDWLSNEDNLKLLCFAIGTAHLMVAHAWNGFVNRRTPQALAQAGWMGTTLCMFFFSTWMVLAHPLPSFTIPLLGVSVVSIVLFMTPPKALKEEWFNHAMLPLSLVSNFMDVVSYVRLYAVGMASLALAMAFNEMAAGFGDGVGARLGAVLVLFFGHALNLVLSAMGVLVHGVRLNALEFSSHIGLSWTGVAYSPFSKRAQAGEQ
jgi:V/A-type H+-transporting ATPase subunit I